MQKDITHQSFSTAMETLNICMVCPSVRIPDNVAQAIHQWEFAKHLSSMGHRVDIFCELGGSSDENKGGEWEKEGVVYHHVPAPHIPYRRILLTMSSLQKVKKFLRSNRVDIVHDRGYILGGSGIWSAYKSGIPSVLQVDDNWLETEAMTSRMTRTWVYRYTGIGWIKWALETAGAAFTVSRTLARIISDISPRSSYRISVVPNGVDPDVFSPQTEVSGLRHRYDIDGPIIMFIGALGPWHGVDNLLNAAPMVIKECPDVKFVFVGGGREFSLVGDMDRIVAELGIKDNVLFTGPLPKDSIPGVIAEADICVAPYPPVDFGFSPFKIFEYMAMEKPVIASDLPSIREIIGHEQEGLLVRSWKREELANAIISLIQDPDLRRDMGRRGRKKILSEYTWRKSTERLVKVYKRAIERV